MLFVQALIQIGQFLEITPFRDGSVWITGENGIARFLPQSETVELNNNWTDYPAPKEMGIYHFTKPFEGKQGEMVVLSKSSKSNKNILISFKSL